MGNDGNKDHALVAVVEVGLDVSRWGRATTSASYVGTMEGVTATSDDGAVEVMEDLGSIFRSRWEALSGTPLEHLSDEGRRVRQRGDQIFGESSAGPVGEALARAAVEVVRAASGSLSVTAASRRGDDSWAVKIWVQIWRGEAEGRVSFLVQVGPWRAGGGYASLSQGMVAVARLMSDEASRLRGVSKEFLGNEGLERRRVLLAIFGASP